MKRISVCVATVLLVSGCASAPQKWNHSSLAGPEADRQYLVDHGECTRQAMAYVAPPPPTPVLPPPPAYTVTGTATTSAGATTTPVVTTYSSTVQPQRSITELMAYVDAAGEAGRLRGQAEYALRTIHVGCMAARGWMQEAPK